VKFPAKIRAVTDGGGERLTMLDSAVPRLEIDLQMFAEKPETPVKRVPRKITKRKDPKPTETVKVVKPPKEEEKKTLTLPALDY
jgi:hypothetical protein